MICCFHVLFKTAFLKSENRKTKSEWENVTLYFPSMHFYADWGQ